MPLAMVITPQKQPQQQPQRAILLCIPQRIAAAEITIPTSQKRIISITRTFPRLTQLQQKMRARQFISNLNLAMEVPDKQFG
jgi:hypothetical protein